MQNMILAKIAALEEEIKALKSLVKIDKKQDKAKKSKKKDPLYGILKGITFSEKDFRDAKKSLFPFDENIK